MEHSFNDAFVTSIQPGKDMQQPRSSINKLLTQQSVERKSKTEEIINLQNKISSYLIEIPNNSDTVKAIQNLGLSSNILSIDLKELSRIICSNNPFGKHQYSRLLAQKASKLNSIIKQVNRMNRMKKTDKNIEWNKQQKTKLQEHFNPIQNKDQMPKTLKCLKFYYKKALIDQLSYRKKNIKILSSKDRIKTQKKTQKKPKYQQNSQVFILPIKQQDQKNYQKKVLIDKTNFKRIGFNKSLNKNQSSKNFHEQARRNRTQQQAQYSKYILALKQHHSLIKNKISSPSRDKRIESNVDQHIKLASSKREQIQQKLFITNLNNFIDKQQDIIKARRTALSQIRNKVNAKPVRSATNSICFQPDDIKQSQTDNIKSFRNNYENNQAIRKKTAYLKTISDGIKAKSQKRFQITQQNLKQNQHYHNNKISSLLSKQIFHKRSNTKQIKSQLIYKNFKLRQKRGELDTKIQMFKNLSEEDLNRQLFNIDQQFLTLVK